MSALALLIISIFSKKFINKIINFIIKIMKKLKIKNVDKNKKN